MTVLKAGTVDILVGMETYRITVALDGSVATMMLTDIGSRPGGSWDDIEVFIDEMRDKGIKTRQRFETAGILAPR